METKTCTKCGEVKALGEFASRKDRFTRRSKCKKCEDLRRKKWLEENPEKARMAKKRWDKNNPDERKTHNKKNVELLTDSYVAGRLKMQVSDAPPELLEAKRQQILIHRATKQLIQTIKEKQDEH